MDSKLTDLMNDKLDEGTILITGANGQIGTALVEALQKKHGTERVLITDIREPYYYEGRFEILDVLDEEAVGKCLEQNNVTQIYHLAALLSSKGEENPAFTWKLNFDAYLSLLRLARKRHVKSIFFPSTIGIYGPTTPKVKTPQSASFQPATVYGISKITAELWNEYFRNKYDMDIRGLRYPGVISHETRPVGGTTDFAVEIFFDAVEKGSYECYLKPDTRLPMLYMPDVLNATLGLMEAEKSSLSTSMAYNISGFSVTPEELADEIKKYIPDFEITYKPDHRQKIADSWTESIDDAVAHRDWNWKAEFDMASMVKDMIGKMRK